MKVEHINAFIISASGVFESAIGITPRKSNLNLKTGYAPSHDVSAVIGLSGNAFGSVVLSFPRASALKAVAKMLGEEEDPEMPDDELADGIGELTNMIAGQAKSKLNDINVKTYISIPRVILGSSHYIYRPKEVPCVEISFDSEIGEFTLGVALKVLQESVVT